MNQYEYLMSACLCGFHCRYDGNEKQNDRCKALYEKGKAVLICPEVMGGLTTPRLPSELHGNQVVQNNGVDVSEQFHRGAKQALQIAKSLQITKAILKDGSPSCGSSIIYDGSFTGQTIAGEGVCAKLLREHGIQVINENEVPSETIK